jgi:hypothetical protein
VTAARANSAKRYIKTRSFNRLNGRSVAPGSEFPERYFLRRRIVLAAVALLLALPGLWALLA